MYDCVVDKSDTARFNYAPWVTHHVVLNTVDARVELLRALQVVLNAVHAQDTNLLECPAGNPSGKLLVLRLGALSTQLGHLGIQPLVLQHLSRAEHSHARRIARLHHRHQRQLLTRSEQLISVEDLGLLLGVIAVRSSRSANDGGQQRARTKDVSHGVREGQDATRKFKVGLEAGANVGRRIKDEDVVGLGGGDGVVVEVVDDGAGALDGQGDVELGEEGDERSGRGNLGGQRNEDVSIGVDEVDEAVWGQVGSKSCMAESANKLPLPNHGITKM